MADVNKLNAYYVVSQQQFYFDSELTTLIQDPIFENNGSYYLDAGCTIELLIHVVNQSVESDAQSTSTCEESMSCSTAGRELCTIDGTVLPSVSQPSTSSASTNMHEFWTTEETKFLINIMGDFVGSGDELPATLTDLERKIKLGRGKKKALWNDVAQQLTCKFDKTFELKHVSRKWQTLVDGYKKTLCNNNSTGRGVTKFAWFKEIDELIGSRHDIHFVATGTQEGITVHREDEVNNVGRADESSGTESRPGTDDKVKAKRLRRKRKADDTDFEDVLKFMKESEDRLVAVEEKLLAEVKEFGTSMKDLLGKVIDKL